MPCAHNKYPQVRLDTTHVLLERTYSSKYCRIVFSSRRLAAVPGAWIFLETGESSTALLLADLTERPKMC